MRKFNNKWYYLSLVSFLIVLLGSGCSRQTATTGPQAAEVKAAQVIQKDTPVTYEYVGQVVAKNEVKIQSKVSGNIVGKMVDGGAYVQAGQPLFQIDRRQYEASLLNAQAQLAQAQATLSQTRRDLARYRQLAAQGAVAQQILDNYITQEQQNIASVNAYQASVEQAEDSLQDTYIVSPLSGRIDVNDLSSGNFVSAGSTTIATISSVDPVFVQFSISESDYLRFAKLGRGSSPAEWFGNLSLVLADGTQYPLTGTVDQVDRGLAQNTGTLTIKAVFANPQRLLVPGMFARVVAQAETRQGALLVPQRAVQKVLDKTFVTVVGEGDKAESRPVKLGPQFGSLWLVEEGLTASDIVVVEGAQKVQPGTPLKVTMMSPEELQTPAQQ